MTPEEQLARVPIFSTLSAHDISLLAQRTRRRTFAPGTLLILGGDTTGSLFIVVTGRVKIHRMTTAGTEVILALLGPGDFFGEMSLLDGEPRSADATAWEPTECLVLDTGALRTAIEASPSLAWQLLRALSLRIRQQNGLVESLATRDVVGRVGECLLQLSERHGEPIPGQAGAVKITLDLTQVELASFVGATRERVNQALRTLKSQSLIKSDPFTKRFLIPNKATLERYVENR